MIRVRLEARGGRQPGEPAVAPAVQDGLERALQGPAARLSHARIRMAAEAPALDAVLFVTATGLLAAEAGARAACLELTRTGAVLAGWRVRHCEADSWLALGLHELPTHR